MGLFIYTTAWGLGSIASILWMGWKFNKGVEK